MRCLQKGLAIFSVAVIFAVGGGGLFTLQSVSTPGGTVEIAHAAEKGGDNNTKEKSTKNNDNEKGKDNEKGEKAELPCKSKNNPRCNPESPSK